jgi:hypothetical protein
MFVRPVTANTGAHQNRLNIALKIDLVLDDGWDPAVGLFGFLASCPHEFDSDEDTNNDRQDDNKDRQQAVHGSITDDGVPVRLRATVVEEISLC